MKKNFEFTIHFSYVLSSHACVWRYMRGSGMSSFCFCLQKGVYSRIVVVNCHTAFLLGRRAPRCIYATWRPSRPCLTGALLQNIDEEMCIGYAFIVSGCHPELDSGSIQYWYGFQIKFGMT